MSSPYPVSLSFIMLKIICFDVNLSMFPCFFIICRADEEPVDQKRYLEEACKPKCVKPLLEYQVQGVLLIFVVWD